ncbi:hypothetical protein GCM10007989_21470 [Devosia pacifica]|uniref:Uncharacterized protein n=1 Tax=Devosia pacifica TaxID=1335967 RepID=A0A918S659_9HYPH|nr:hypothetical protein [Devosia pacifica]GHA25506.1 hypothetical protein GCM10007989_21470 [Devosia pacifica]
MQRIATVLAYVALVASLGLGFLVVTAHADTNHLVISQHYQVSTEVN